MHQADIAAILSSLVGIGALAADATFAQQMQSIAGGHAAAILAGLGVLGTLASVVLRVVYNPSQSASRTTQGQ